MIFKYRNWLFALLLTAPMLVFFLGYLFNHSKDLVPTGFIQHDNISYMAYAKQYLDSDKASIFYSNPFNDSDDHQPIYFQTQTILFAVLLKAGIPPGWILIPFTLICSLICFRLLISIYDHMFPGNKYRTISIWLFAWGGGLLTLGGFFAQLLYGSLTVNSIFFLDPGAGWWGLNFGRSLFFSCEAYYHFLFLSVIYCLLKQKWAGVLAISAILSVSHPFTGIELLSIASAWLLAEKIVFKNKSIPAWLVTGEFLILLFHLYYYLYFLNQFNDHQSVNEQYALNWRLRFFSIIPAYFITGLLALLSVLKTSKPGKFFFQSKNRLLLLWFLVAFSLANHEMIMKPMQPLHFTRGYIWTSLFLLGIPALHYLFSKLSVSVFQKINFVFFLLLFFSDNLVWIYKQSSVKTKTTSTSYLNFEQQGIFALLNKHTTNRTLIIGTDELIPYMSTVYTKAYPWLAHPFTTPYVAQKRAALSRFIVFGETDPSWKGKDLIFVIDKKDSLAVKRVAKLSYPATILAETVSYNILEAVIR
ncbi:MAG: hypothetical protein WBC06_04545 [Chitinophagaceae bacterium]